MSKPVQLWRYVLPSIKHEGWGVFLIDSTGYFSCVTDYGAYAHLWTHHGCNDFREFLLRAEESWDYFVGKLSPGKTYDGDKTKQSIKEEILRARRNSVWRKDFARTEYDLWRESDFFSEVDFSRWYEETAIRDAHELSVYSHDNQCTAMVKKLMPRLAALLRADLEGAARAAAMCSAQGGFEEKV